MFRIFWGPFGVSLMIASIQWAVTARNATRLVFVHMFIVKEILPRDFCYTSYVSISLVEKKTYLHLTLKAL